MTVQTKGVSAMRKCNLVAVFLILGLCVPAMAQVDVEVGGDIQVRSIYRNDFGLTPGTAGSQDWFDSYIRVYAEGHPSPDVSAIVRIIGERDWGTEGITTVDPVTGGTESRHTTQIDLDLAYLTLKNAWGSPATFVLGRQELLYGEGFLIGRNNTYRTTTYERSMRKAFDALKLSFGLTPFTLDFFTALIVERYDDSDVELYGANLKYDYLSTATIDLGMFYKVNSLQDAKTIAFSVRGESEIIAIPGLKLKAEIVPQIGSHNSNRDLNALGGYAGILYGSMGHVCFISEPYIGVNYISMSGEENPGASSGDYEQFDQLYEDEVYGEINEVNGSLGLNTNAKILNVKLGGKFTDAASVELDYYGIGRNKQVSGSDDFGTEIDFKLNYEYTEDVSFALIIAYFDPKPAIGTEEALQITGAVKLSF
jgi:hypothetical protein